MEGVSTYSLIEEPESTSGISDAVFSISRSNGTLPVVSLSAVEVNQAWNSSTLQSGANGGNARGQACSFPVIIRNPNAELSQAGGKVTSLPTRARTAPICSLYCGAHSECRKTRRNLDVPSMANPMTFFSFASSPGGSAK